MAACAGRTKEQTELPTLTMESTPEAKAGADDGLLQEVVRRCRQVYTVPAVAAEVVRLTDHPRVDVAALKTCIERDAGLTAKLLRVVNSPAFSLRGEVGDLNQALALLGVNPLKQLVLGFSLPEQIFAAAGERRLEWYWQTTLARCAAARLIDATAGTGCGDEAFLAALLQDMGVLVLIDQLGNDYGRVLDAAIEGPIALADAEREALGFDHRQLSAALLSGWGLPRSITDAIGAPRSVDALRRRSTAGGTTARVLHAADLIAQLVAQHRLGLLPELIEAAGSYFSLEEKPLRGCLEELQEKVDQLAEAFSVGCEAEDFHEIVSAAHRQMSEGAEAMAARMNGDRPVVLGVDAASLRRAVASLASGGDSVRGSAAVLDSAVQLESPFTDLASRLTLAVGHCRSLRQPLSVLVCETRVLSGDERAGLLLSQLLAQLCKRTPLEGAETNQLESGRPVVVLPDCDRKEAVQLAGEIASKLRAAASRIEAVGGVPFQTRVGAATVTLASRNFPPGDLLDAAGRCLEAAPAVGDGVKSIELF
ncbi:MAG: HDOD domain-containing protein [Planctomycetota bacterium]